MKAGQLDRTILVQRASIALNQYGEAAQTWAPLATLRARLVTASIDELATAAGREAAGALTFETRFMDGLTVADRLIYAGAEHDIQHVAEVGRRMGLIIRAVARQH